MTLEQPPDRVPFPALGSASEARRGLRDHVYDRILNMLLRGDAPPGTRLSIDTIARQLDVSPTPVREALVQLERTGLVTRQALKGYRVAPPLERAQLAELFDAREMLESTAARFAAHAADRTLLTELREAQKLHRDRGEQLIAQFRSGAIDLDLAADYYACDQAFHAVIFDHSGNRYLKDMSEGLGALVHRLRQAVLRGGNDVEVAIAEHNAIIRAFETQGPEGAAEAVRTHIRNVRTRSLHDED